MRMLSSIKTSTEQMLPTFDYTITVINKLKAQHSATKLDVWYKTVLHHNAFTSQTMRNVTGTTASVASVYTVRVPLNDKYTPYSEWISDPSQGFTFSLGDIIIKGVIDEITITPNNVNQILQKYQPNAFTVKSFKDNTGTIELAEHYHIEGV